MRHLEVYFAVACAFFSKRYLWSVNVSAWRFCFLTVGVRGRRRYVEVAIKMEKKLTEHDKFYGGDAKEIRERLIEQKKAAGGKGTPYCLGFNPSPMSSGFILFWLPGTKTVQEEKVKITVGGYMFRGQSFQSPARLINYFKQHAMDLFKQQNQSTQPSPPPPAYKPVQQQGWDGGGMGRPPPPVQWGIGSSQTPPHGQPPGGPPAAAAAAWNGPPRGGGGWGGAGGGGGAPPPQYPPPPANYVPQYAGPPGVGPPPPNQPPLHGGWGR